MKIVLLLALILTTYPSYLHAADATTIGCILPLTGRFSAFGSRVLQGIELAVTDYNKSKTGINNPVRLVIKDSAGAAKTAEKAVEELDSDDAVAIIGPILGITAERAAASAQTRGIPLVSMTQKEGITALGEWVFRSAATASAQVRGVASQAYKEGVKKVAILYPDNTSGREQLALFTKEFTGLGGKITASKSYIENRTDFGPEIKALVAQEENNKTKKKDGDINNISFDAIFIPDVAERAGLIIPQLAYYDVRGVRLLGTGGWNAASLVRLAGDYLDNSIFSDSFFVESKKPEVSHLVESYRHVFGEDPGTLEAQAFDTTGIILSLIGSGNKSRKDIREGLNRVKNYGGATGSISFKERDAIRDVFLLTVKNGRIEEVWSH